MSDPTLTDLIKQFIKNHGFKVDRVRPQEWHLSHISSPTGFHIYKHKVRLGQIDVDEKGMKIKLTLNKALGDTVVNTSNDNVNVYDPDSFPKIVERLNAAFVLMRQGDL
jgi:hypothetical protein